MALALKNEVTEKSSSMEAGTAQHFIACWLMEYSTENHRQTQVASCFSKGLIFVVLFYHLSGGPNIPLWGPTIANNSVLSNSLLFIKSLLILFPWGSIETE